MLKIILACDYQGIELKKQIYKYAQDINLDIEDIGIDDGSSMDYIDITKSLVNKMRYEKALGIIICGNDQGAAMAANRYNDMRAVVCQTVEDAKVARSELNANILCLGSEQTGFEQIKACLHAFIETPFKEGKHEKSAAKLSIKGSEHIKDNINLIVRAAITSNKNILLTRTTSCNSEFPIGSYFLPGGHVDYKEPAIEALKRELIEEANFHIDKANFAGVLECAWQRNDFIYHELNLVYKVDSDWSDVRIVPESTEAFIEFVWYPIEKLSEVNILPKQMKELLINIYSTNSKKPLFYSQM